MERRKHVEGFELFYGLGDTFLDPDAANQVGFLSLEPFFAVSYNLIRFQKDGLPGVYKQAKIALSLFDIKNDPYETKDVKNESPKVLNTLKKYAFEHKKKFYNIGVESRFILSTGD